ncbi:hypothetical protein [Rhodococcus erythropolis]|uniref:hypothetical protein n=1 Tax=Rhodococcus erythropolis TaxID=1833 RepID=UPI001BEBA453|nr:hypothetical protein [Rhodococcus erythropolis]MBT2263518.1 hypothetical protein [Rhodococcus erythropolis]
MTAHRACSSRQPTPGSPAGGALFPSEIDGAYPLPWIVHAEHLHSFPARSVRSHVRFIATGGVGMRAFELGALRDFYDILREFDSVLEYDPQVRPLRGFCFDGGFRLMTRSTADRNLVIRLNDYTILQAADPALWSIPERMPTFVK